MGDRASGAGRAYAQGFFGCFGVLGAIVAVIAGLMILGTLRQGQAARRADADLAALPALNQCGRAVLAARDLVAGFDQFDPTAAPAGRVGPRGRLRCTLRRDGAVFILDAQTRCADLDRRTCWGVEAATLDGVALLRKR